MYFIIYYLQSQRPHSMETAYDGLLNEL